VLIGLAAMYALYLRPAALFVLAAYIVVAVVIALFKTHETRRRVFLAAGSCLMGALVAYGTWAYRNYKVFGTFQYSTVSGYNLLHYNASRMESYLDQAGKRELNAALAQHPIFLERYSGLDQFVVSNDQAKEGVRLILKYPLPFLQSHFEAVIQSFFVFSPTVLKSYGAMPVVATSIVHFGLAVMGILGLAASWKTFSELQRLSLLLMLTVGVVSTLTGGVLFSPRFRIPLDVLLAVGCALFVMRALRRICSFPLNGVGWVIL
jgi:hypothetical protein